MYAGHDGNVYKNTGSGWQTYNNGSWNDVNKPTQQQVQQKTQSYSQEHPNSGAGNYSQSKPMSSTSDLNQQAQDRQRGATESQRYSQGRSSWGDRGGGGGRSWGGRR
jgi:hypothetical protein